MADKAKSGLTPLEVQNVLHQLGQVTVGAPLVAGGAGLGNLIQNWNAVPGLPAMGPSNQWQGPTPAGQPWMKPPYYTPGANPADSYFQTNVPSQVAPSGKAAGGGRRSGGARTAKPPAVAAASTEAAYNAAQAAHDTWQAQVSAIQMAQEPGATFNRGAGGVMVLQKADGTQIALPAEPVVPAAPAPPQAGQIADQAAAQSAAGPAPKKWLGKVNGKWKINPEWKKWEKAGGGSASSSEGAGSMKVVARTGLAGKGGPVVEVPPTGIDPRQIVTGQPGQDAVAQATGQVQAAYGDPNDPNSAMAIARDQAGPQLSPEPGNAMANGGRAFGAMALARIGAALQGHPELGGSALQAAQQNQQDILGVQRQNMIAQNEFNRNRSNQMLQVAVNKTADTLKTQGEALGRTLESELAKAQDEFQRTKLQGELGLQKWSIEQNTMVELAKLHNGLQGADDTARWQMAQAQALNIGQQVNEQLRMHPGNPDKVQVTITIPDATGKPVPTKMPASQAIQYMRIGTQGFKSPQMKKMADDLFDAMIIGQVHTYFDPHEVAKREFYTQRRNDSFLRSMGMTMSGQPGAAAAEAAYGMAAGDNPPAPVPLLPGAKP